MSFGAVYEGQSWDFPPFPLIFDQNTNYFPLSLLSKVKLHITLISLFSLQRKPSYAELSTALPAKP